MSRQRFPKGFTLIQLPFDRLPSGLSLRVEDRVVRQRKPKGFTLIELLVVISIIALLISILLPALRKARESGKVLQCLSNCRSIAAAMHVYTDDYDGYFCPRTLFEHDANGNLIPVMDSVFMWVGQKGTKGNYALGDASLRYLNRYIYNRFLEPDEEVPFARCPSDIGSSWSNQDPYFEAAGTSYGQNAHRGYHSLVRYNQFVQMGSVKFSIPIRNTDVLAPSMLVMGAEQGAQNYAWGEQFPYVLSFHSPEPRFSVMFVDSHAAFIEVPKPEAPNQKHTSGPGWTWDEVGRKY